MEGGEGRQVKEGGGGEEWKERGIESIWFMSSGMERLAVRIISEVDVGSNSTRNSPRTTSDLSKSRSF